MADLWSLIDEALKAEAEASTDLGVVKVLIDTVYNFDHLVDRYELPLLLITSTEATESDGAHGGDPDYISVTSTYAYRLVVVSDVIDDKTTAWLTAKQYRRKLLNFYRKRTTQAAISSQQGDDGELVQQVNWGRSSVEVFGKAHEDEGPYFGVAVARFTVDTLSV